MKIIAENIECKVDNTNAAWQIAWTVMDFIYSGRPDATMKLLTNEDRVIAEVSFNEFGYALINGTEHVFEEGKKEISKMIRANISMNDCFKVEKRY